MIGRSLDLFTKRPIIRENFCVSERLRVIKVENSNAAGLEMKFKTHRNFNKTYGQLFNW